jgi:hypothetical protein
MPAGSRDFDAGHVAAVVHDELFGFRIVRELSASVGKFLPHHRDPSRHALPRRRAQSERRAGAEPGRKKIPPDMRESPAAGVFGRFFQSEDVGAALPRLQRRDEARGSGADHDDVVLFSSYAGGEEGRLSRCPSRRGWRRRW